MLRTAGLAAVVFVSAALACSDPDSEPARSGASGSGASGGSGGAGGSGVCVPACGAGEECVDGECRDAPPACGAVGANERPRGFDAADLRAITARLDDPTDVIVGTRSGVYRSDDGGKTFTFWGLTGLEVSALRFTPSGRLYAGTRGEGVFRRDDGASSWEPVWGQDRLLVSDIEIDPTEAETLYVTAMATDLYPWDDGALYVSNDAGATWAALFDYTTVCSTLGFCSNALPSYLGGVEIDPDNVLSIWLSFWDTDGVTPYGIWQSDDGGSSWQPNTALGEGIWIDLLALDPEDPARLYAGVATDQGGLYRTTDYGGAWSSIGPPSQRYRALGVPPSSSPYALHTTSGNTIASLNAVGQWVTSTIVPVAGPIFDSGQAIFVGSSAYLFQSADPAGPWQNTSRGMDGVNVSGLAVAGDVLYAATEIGIYRASASDYVWHRMGADLPELFQATAIATDPVDETILYFAAYDGGPKFAKSVDGGLSWTAHDLGLPATYLVRHIEVRAGTDARRTFMVFGHDLGSESAPAFVSDDLEAGWTALSYPFRWTLSVATTPALPGQLWAGGMVGETGVFEVGPDEAIVATYTAGLPDLVQPWALAVMPEPPTLAVGLFHDADSLWFFENNVAAWQPRSRGAPDPAFYFPTALAAARWTPTFLAGFSRKGLTAPVAGLGVHRWDGAQAAWARVSDAPVRGAEVILIEPDPACRDRAFVATWGGGLERVFVTGE